MTFSFRPAVRENVGLLIGLAGGTGSGKTFSAMRLAAGMAGDKPFAVIDTEAGRAKHYAGTFRFDHGDLKPPFTPDAYAEAIKAADDAKYTVIVVDSGSHEHAGDGGILDMHEDELDRMAGDNWQKREACKMAAWIKPKMQHKAMVNRLLQIRAHIILCFRAEEKVEMVREDGKMKIVPKQSRTGKNGWVPVCEKNLPFEMTASFLLHSDNPGFPIPIKLEDQHRALFPPGKPIDEATGRALAAWASGAPPAQNVRQEQPQATPETITRDQCDMILGYIRDAGKDVSRFCEHYQIETALELPASEYAKAVAMLKKAASKRDEMDERVAREMLAKDGATKPGQNSDV